MPGKVIGQSLDYGFPGSYSRNADCVIANRVGTEKIPFGAPVVLTPDNRLERFSTQHDADDLAGVAVRIVKQATSYYGGGVEYQEDEPVDYLTRGSVVVEITSGQPAANAHVFIRTAVDPAFPGSAVGDFVAAGDPAFTEELPHVVFTTGKKDGNGVAEITVLRRQA